MAILHPLSITHISVSLASRLAAVPIRKLHVLACEIGCHGRHLPLRWAHWELLWLLLLIGLHKAISIIRLVMLMWVRLVHLRHSPLEWCALGAHILSGAHTEIRSLIHHLRHLSSWRSPIDKRIRVATISGVLHLLNAVLVHLCLLLPVLIETNVYDNYG